MALIAVLLTSPISAIWALQIERPDIDTDIKKVIEKSGTDNYGSVGLGVLIDDYDNEASEGGGADIVVLNVSMVGNTRMGIQYDYIADDKLYSWMWENYSGPDVTVLQEFVNCGDDWGTWADLPWGFRFKFYGGKYRNYPEESLYSKVWICTNGFISFDLSNSTNSWPNVIPSHYSPNGIIAPLWTDLKIDDQSKITTKTRNFVGNLYFIVIWKNALHKSTGKRLTFAVALKGYNWFDEENPSLLGGWIYMAYQDVKPIDGVFTYGIEDHAGLKGAGDSPFGNELGALNGKTLIFYQSTSNYFIKHMTLTFEDQSPNVRCKILDGVDYIRGLNMKTRIDPAPEMNEGEAWLKPIISTVTAILPYAGAATGYSAILGPVGTLIGFGLISWGFYDAYTLHQYNGIEWLELESGSHYAYIKVPSNSSVVEDASLDIVFYWLWDQPNYLSTQHSLTITAIVEYQEFGTGGRIANATTSLNIEVGPDNNNDFDSAYDMQAGTYGEDPMLYLGGYDRHDFYRIGFAESDRITVTMTPPYSQDFDLYLYNPARQEKKSSVHDNDSTEQISFQADSTGYWFIEVRWAGGNGFYNMTVKIAEFAGCPTLFGWNGTDYAEEDILDIHAESDITVQHQIQQTLVKDGAFYKLSLRELDNFTSHIDQVKLYAVDSNGEKHICPLVCAVHNQQGWITYLLRFDDDQRIDLAPTQTIDLKFTGYKGDIDQFIFEINGYNKKIL